MNNDNDLEFETLIEIRKKIKSFRYQDFGGKYLTDPYDRGKRDAYQFLDNILNEILQGYYLTPAGNLKPDRDNSTFDILRDFSEDITEIEKFYSSTIFKETRPAKYYEGYHQTFLVVSHYVAQVLSDLTKNISKKEGDLEEIDDQEDFEDNY